MNRVVLELVNQVVQVHEWIIDRHNLGLARILRKSSSERESTNAAESVDAHPYCRHSV